MKAVPLLALLGTVAACGGGGEPAAPTGPMARTDDLWPYHSRVAVTALPDAEAIERACGEASSRAIQEAERKNPGLIVDPSFHDYPVRNPVCLWEEGSASTANCRFEQAQIYIEFPTAEQRADALRRMRADEWEPYRARFVHVRGGTHGTRWIAPRSCREVRRQSP